MNEDGKLCLQVPPLVSLLTSSHMSDVPESDLMKESLEELYLVIMLPILVAIESAFSVLPARMSLFFFLSKLLTSGVMKAGS